MGHAGVLAGRLLYGSLQWLALAAVLGFARRHLNHDGPARRYLTAAIFPVYILHQTVIVIFAHALKPAHFAPPVEAVVLVLGCAAACFLGVEVIRRVGFLKPLFGYSDPAVRAPVGAAGAARRRAPRAGRLAPGPALMPAARRLPWYHRGTLLYLGAGLLFGGYLGLNQILDLLGTQRFDAWEPLLWETSSVVVIFALLPAIAALERRVPVDARPRGRVVLAHAAGVLLFSALHVTLMVAIRMAVYRAAGRHYEFGSIPLRGFYELQKDLITYAVVLTVCFAYRQVTVRRAGELRAAALAAELAEARLRQLTAQIEPHFLFNTLNAISNRMHEDVEAADRMISQLGSLLRTAYDTGSALTVPLGAELAWLGDYAAMMSERFRGKLIIEIRVAPGLEALPVPRLLLQPLLENALRHGLPEGRGRVEVEVHREQARLHVEVRDDGVGLQDTARTGTGLANVEHRLRLLYPGTAQFELGARTPVGTRVRLSFPVPA